MQNLFRKDINNSLKISKLLNTSAFSNFFEPDDRELPSGNLT